MFKKLLEQVQNELDELSQALQGESASEIDFKPSVFSREQRLLDILSNEKTSQALFQLNQLQSKYLNAKKILNQQLNPNELTYSRYYSLIEPIYTSALDNLESIALASQSMSQIDVIAIQLRLSQSLDIDNSEHQSLQQRLTLHQQQSQRIADYLQRNEYALTALDQATTQLANIKIQADDDLEIAIDALNQWLDKTQNYNPPFS